MAKNLDAVRNDGTKGKTVQHTRLTGEEFAKLLDAADLSEADFAYLWGTRPEKVRAWIKGEDGIPFPIAWCLPLLQNQLNFNDALAIVDKRASALQQVVRRHATRAKIAELLTAIDELVPEVNRLIENWKAANDQPHPYEDALRRLDIARNARGIMNMARQSQELEEIAGILGLGLDVNEEIAKTNANFIKVQDGQRRARTAEYRDAKRFPAAIQVRQHYEKSGLEARSEEDGRIFIREPRGEWRDVGTVSDYRLIGNEVRRLKEK